MRKHCFTLLELTVATGILLSVASLIGLASMTFYKAWNQAEKHSIALKEYHAIDIIMDSCVRNMIPFTWTDENNETGSNFVFDGQEDSIFFVSLRRNYRNDDGGMVFMRIKLDQDKKLVAEYSNYPRFPWTQENDLTLPMQEEILASGVQRVSFIYGAVRSSQMEWLDSWDRETNEFLPMAIQMTVEWEDGRTEQWLRRVAGASSNSYFGSSLGDLGANDAN